MAIYEDIKTIKGIGDKTAKLFNKLGIYNIEQLLNYYPRTYAKYEPYIKLKDATIGEFNAFNLNVVNDFVLRNGNRIKTLSGYAYDGENSAQITFFNMPYLKKDLIKDANYIFYGKLLFEHNKYVLEQPVIYSLDDYNDMLNTLHPVYSLTKGLSNKTIQKAVKLAIYDNEYPFLYDEYLPQNLINEFNLMNRKEAFINIHYPENENKLLEAKKRLSFDELFIFLYSLRLLRKDDIKVKSDFKFIDTALPNRLIEKLPFRLTNAQLKAYEEIKSDLLSQILSNRMIQGDVGAGKTIVAILSLLLCTDNGYQGALMAPTELLALQHFNNLSKMNEEYNLNLNIALLTGSTTSKNKKLIYENIQNGNINIIIGTHALIQEKVDFKNLALVITDEQHRFGVIQRQTLANKGIKPHVIVMSATPIPRSLSMVLYGDIHLTIIDEKPSNRLPIKNCVVGPSYHKTAYSFIEKEINNGRQVYIICPMIEASSELLKVENVIDYTNKIKNIFGEKINIAMLHGQMKAEEKNNIMDNFLKHNIDILVSTTVIEVGIDVPNATVMMIENAERFGLAQLHQLRGRIGRGNEQSYCIFINSDNKNNKRLEILNRTNDGFEVAKEDLKLRGSGDIFGIRQSGDMDFKIADIYEDSYLLLGINKFFEDLHNDENIITENEKEILYNYLIENKEKYVDFNSI